MTASSWWSLCLARSHGGVFADTSELHVGRERSRMNRVARKSTWRQTESVKLPSSRIWERHVHDVGVRLLDFVSTTGVTTTDLFRQLSALLVIHIRRRADKGRSR